VRRADNRVIRSSVPSGPEAARRRSIRLESYDYPSAGAYFVTLCTAHREPLLGRVAGGRTVEIPNVKVIRGRWLGLPDHYPHVGLDAFVVMPGHVHGIVVLGGTRPIRSESEG
jgi:REP element-mobilizing transposase RayT